MNEANEPEVRQMGTGATLIVMLFMMIFMFCWPMIAMGLLFLGFLACIAAFIGAILLFEAAVASGMLVAPAIAMLLFAVFVLTLVGDRALKATGRRGLIRHSPGKYEFHTDGALDKVR